MKFLIKHIALLFFILIILVGYSMSQEYNYHFYLKKASDFHAIPNYDSSLFYYNKALKLAEESGDRIQEAYINKLIGTDFIYMGQYDTALVYLRKSKTLAEKLNNDTIRAITNLNIGPCK